MYKDLASAVVSEVAKTKFSKKRPDITYDEDSHMIQVDDAGVASKDESETDVKAQTITPANLRRACRCAACVEEMTGRQILVATDIQEAIKPMKMTSTGNYALSVDWSDGHRSLYPYRQIQSLLEEQAASPASQQKETALQGSWAS